jgi:hypothetical protein
MDPFAMTTTVDLYSPPRVAMERREDDAVLRTRQ